MKKNVGILLLSVITTLIFTIGCWKPLNSDSAFDLSTVIFDELTYPIVILGGGVAGLSAALCNKQSNMPCLVIEGCKQGSALSQSHAVQNWPGVMQTPGAEIVNNMREQVLTSSDVHLVKQDAVTVNFSSWPYGVKTKDASGNETTYKALSIIITMGAIANKLNVEGENDYWGHGVGNCALCDGFLYKNKVIAVVGGGDSAVEEASYLSDIAAKVYILVRSKQFSAKNKQALGRLLKRTNVKIFYATQIKKINGDGQHVTSVVLLNNEGVEEVQPLDGIFLAIGSRPNTALFKNKLNLDEQGFILLKHFQETSLPGIYAAGDISDRDFVQAYTAGGDGYKAAMQATKFLNSLGFERSMLKVPPIRNISIVPNDSPTKKEEKENDTIIEIKTLDDFKKYVIASSKPTFIDVFSTLCIPCQQMMPVVDQCAKTYDGKILFVKINIAKKGLDMLTCLNSIGGKPVDSVPTFIFVKKGIEVGRLIGMQEEATFKKTIDTLFNIEH